MILYSGLRSARLFVTASNVRTCFFDNLWRLSRIPGVIAPSYSTLHPFHPPFDPGQYHRGRYCLQHVTSSLSTEIDQHNKQQELDDKKKSLVQRFKKAYSIYGKVVIVIHGVTSCFWFAAAYLTAYSGLNLLELFESAHFPDWLCRPLRMGGGTVNQWATALVLYKLVAPFRYGLTLVLTRYLVRHLRATGKAPAVTEHTRLRNLARESAHLSRERLRMRVSKSRSKATRSFMSRFRR